MHENPQPMPPAPRATETLPRLPEIVAAASSTFRATTLRPKTRPARERLPALRAAPATRPDPRALQNLVRAPTAAIRVLRESARIPIQARHAPNAAPERPLRAVQERTWSSAATAPAACRIPIRLARSAT